ncbi:hypothetical protein [Burkholderia diffusa]|uniref:hypothetical protein n=1 Tax=Burkholderia diffusa TaxID=488732 RepID=UPI0039EE7A6C
MSSARRSGCCAISGSPIVRGEQVFRPVLRPTPVNHEAMICPDSIRRIIASTADDGSGPCAVAIMRAE